MAGRDLERRREEEEEKKKKKKKKKRERERERERETTGAPPSSRQTTRVSDVRRQTSDLKCTGETGTVRTSRE